MTLLPTHEVFPCVYNSIYEIKRKGYGEVALHSILYKHNWEFYTFGNNLSTFPSTITLATTYGVIPSIVHLLGHKLI